jgi:uncharacterized protein (TIGR00730 family)
LAARRIELVYGGGSVGLMGVLAAAVLGGGGRVTGVIPGPLVARELAHTGLTDLRVVSSMHERKSLMAELADGFIALPGGLGTLEELFEVLSWAQLGIHRKPVAVLNAGQFYDGLLRLLEHAVGEGFLLSEHFALLRSADTAVELLDIVLAWRPPRIPRPWLSPTET